MQNIAILLATVAVLAVLVSPRVASAPIFRATITPLASIIGSGFLILGPVLIASYGAWAPVVMAALCLAAYGFGGAIRYNIDRLAAQPHGRLSAWLEHGASWVLAIAYFVSVAFYLNLFGAFAVSLTTLDTPEHARQVASAVLLLLLAVGWSRGFGALERMELVSVSVKLAIIAGLLVGLVVYFSQSALDGRLVASPPSLTGWPAISLAFGLIVTVQGFETSRYLGAAYDALLRIRSMRLAQWIAAGIYVVYITLLAFDFDVGAVELSETAVIKMMAVVAPILPGLLVAAALSAQFSAAVADTVGAGGLVRELTNGFVSQRAAYAVLIGFGLVLTWRANVFEIIAYASRAFALYYGLQALIAAITARGEGAHGRAAAYLALAGLGGAITLLGAPVE